MRLIIEAEGVKRELNGPFRLCAGANDLRALRDQLDRIISEPFTYGWNTIWPAPQDAGPDTPPQTWRSDRIG